MGPTEVCNMSLARIGAKRINDFDDASDTKVEAIYCRLFYNKTRDALMRSHLWRFAKARVALSADTVTPAFQWDYQFHLPNDFLRLVSVFDDSDTVDGRPLDSYELEGKMLMMNSSSVNLRYIKQVDDVNEWDPLFLEVFVLAFAKKLIIPLSQDIKLKKDIDDDLYPLLRKVRAMDRNEGTRIGRYALKTWLDARTSNYP